ncbi:MAG: zinc ribbon domain-containing protein [Candidatus Omnitrophica bacterium]|nr:zinc ribbon domain-containing protein [Candidatus Omnitrophota bacterium]
MPTYEFECLNCKENFELKLSLDEYNAKKFTCPKCKSNQLKQKVSSFFAQTDSKT